MQIPAPREPPTIQGFAGDSDMHVARAMERVLEAERAAQSAITDCDAQGQKSLECARRQARRILEHGHERIIALHTKAASSLEQQQASHHQNADPTSAIAARQGDLVRFETAIARLADSLVGTGIERI